MPRATEIEGQRLRGMEAKGHKGCRRERDIDSELYRDRG